jgi:hypothetical protein
MDMLVIENKTWNIIRFSLGILMIIAGIANFLSNPGTYHFKDFLLAGFFVIAGIGKMTSFFWTNKTYFQVSGSGLTIKLPGKLKAINTDTSEIESITLQKSQIVINIKIRKPLKIRLYSFELAHKRQIHNFMVEYSRENNIPLKKEA